MSTGPNSTNGDVVFVGIVTLCFGKSSIMLSACAAAFRKDGTELEVRLWV